MKKHILNNTLISSPVQTVCHFVIAILLCLVSYLYRIHCCPCDRLGFTLHLSLMLTAIKLYKTYYFCHNLSWIGYISSSYRCILHLLEALHCYLYGVHFTSLYSHTFTVCRVLTTNFRYHHCGIVASYTS
jgi:hypothetical protein